MRGYPHFSFWIPIILAKIYFFLIVITFAKIHLCFTNCCAVFKKLRRKKTEIFVNNEAVFCTNLYWCEQLKTTRQHQYFATFSVKWKGAFLKKFLYCSVIYHCPRRVFKTRGGIIGIPAYRIRIRISIQEKS